MNEVRVNLPQSLHEFVLREAKREGHSTEADYVHALIRKARERENIERLEQSVIEALRTGPAVVADNAFWERRRAELIRRHAQSKSA